MPGMTDFRHSALLIIGHGSTENPDSSAPTLQHADEIRRRGIFREVVCAFWKEEPSLRQVDYMIDSRQVFVVPNFISEGYFTREVLPRELGLTGPTTEINGKRFHYCDPVGIHSSMTKLLAERVHEVAPGVDRDSTALIIVGHGTALNKKSTEAIKAQVELLKTQQLPVREVIDAYMEEQPFIAKWDELTDAENVIVVPFFIADGLHSFQDIPVLLGIENELPAAASQSTVFRESPIRLRGRNLFFSRAIGTDASIADVILDQVRDFPEQIHGLQSSAIPTPVFETPIQIGEVAISGSLGKFELRHVADSEIPAELLLAAEDPFAAREFSKYADSGEFRPLKAAPNLKRGWRLQLRSAAEVAQAIDEFYPAALGMNRDRESLRIINFRDTLDRQTGMYRYARSLSDEGALKLINERCGDGCLRKVLWKLSSDIETGLPAESESAGVLPILCPEACNLLVAEARKVSKAEFEAAEVQS
ncbi:MAG: sirohydrochlorin cobaltochelatase [Verrucomicrobiales bacterium]|jgi:sirohydrochlorin cobaltochelatase